MRYKQGHGSRYYESCLTFKDKDMSEQKKFPTIVFLLGITVGMLLYQALPVIKQAVIYILP